MLYLRAAKRHAGGAAAANWVEMATKARKSVDLAPNILRVFFRKSLNCSGLLGIERELNECDVGESEGEGAG